MIRYDIMKFISNENLDDIFLEHREGIDPENYRVGQIKDNIFVFNPQNGLIMDYFFDDSKEDWFKLNIIYPDRVDYDKYLINKKGDVIGYKGKLIKL